MKRIGYRENWSAVSRPPLRSVRSFSRPQPPRRDFQSPAINPSPQRIFRTPGNPRSRRMASRPSVLRARSVSRFGGILRCEGDKFRFDHRTRLDNIFQMLNTADDVADEIHRYLSYHALSEGTWTRRRYRTPATWESGLVGGHDSCRLLAQSVILGEAQK